MSGIVKVFLLLAAMVCISKALIVDNSGQQCLCQKVRSGIRKNEVIKDIQIYSATLFCGKVEIVVSTNIGHRYCLDLKLEAVQRLMAAILSRKSKASTTASPTVLSSTSTSGSTSTARILDQ